MEIMTMLYQRRLFLKDTSDYDDDSDEEDNNSCHTVLTNNQWGRYCNEYRGKPILVNKGKHNNDEHTSTHTHNDELFIIATDIIIFTQVHTGKHQLPKSSFLQTTHQTNNVGNKKDIWEHVCPHLFLAALAVLHLPLSPIHSLTANF